MVHQKCFMNLEFIYSVKKYAFIFLKDISTLGKQVILVQNKTRMTFYPKA